MKPFLRALVFDVDGTLADTEATHRIAFNRAFAEQGLDWEWDTPLYTRLLEVSGGKERMLHYWRTVRSDAGATPPAQQQDLVRALHIRKTAHYERMVADGEVRMRPGVLALLREAGEAGLRLAIATTTSPANVDALLCSALGAGWRGHFEVVEDGETAPVKKPDPQVYLQALSHLSLGPCECLAFEDSSNGLQAARAAGLPVIVTPNEFTAHHDFTGALQVVPSLEGVDVARLAGWQAACAC